MGITTKRHQHVVDCVVTDSYDVKNAYLVHVGLPTGDIVTDVIVTEFDSEDYDMVIGMDIISKGDFAITNKDEKTTFSFRVPSVEEIDFSSTVH